MLEVLERHNTWEPECLDDLESRFYRMGRPAVWAGYDHVFVIFKTEPFIDAMYVRYPHSDSNEPDLVVRFVFHEGYYWNEDLEELFWGRVVCNRDCYVDRKCMDEIFRYYSQKYPQWHLKRYYTNPTRMLDHIHHCMMQQTVKEMLYKSGLDEIALIAGMMDEVDLSATKPSELFEGLSMRSLRALNCRDGAMMLAGQKYRQYLLELQKSYPEIFKSKMNDAQCRYLRRLIDGKLLVGETGRLYLARRKELATMWCLTQYEIFLEKIEPNGSRKRWDMREIRELDPIYDDYFKDAGTCSYQEYLRRTQDAQSLKYYLIIEREDRNASIRRRIRKDRDRLQERDQGYVVRLPQTINDFCRESIYMRNCLLSYLEAWICGDTDILFMRHPDDVNKPFITIEIFHGRLKQAYHRFNRNCTPEEARWIRDYCQRHEINCDDFSFGERVDLLF